MHHGVLQQIVEFSADSSRRCSSSDLAVQFWVRVSKHNFPYILGNPPSHYRLRGVRRGGSNRNKLSSTSFLTAVGGKKRHTHRKLCQCRGCSQGPDILRDQTAEFTHHCQSTISNPSLFLRMKNVSRTRRTTGTPSKRFKRAGKAGIPHGV